MTPAWWSWSLPKLKAIHRNVKKPGFKAFFQHPRDVQNLRNRIAEIEALAARVNKRRAA